MISMQAARILPGHRIVGIWSHLGEFCAQKKRRITLRRKPPYSSLGASTGQTPAQAPQEMQSSALMMYLSSPSLMQLVGHSSTHAPQLIQSSVMKYAISNTSVKSYGVIIQQTFINCKDQI
jgi:hypothetical protein